MKTITKTIEDNQVFVGVVMTKGKYKKLVEANAKMSAGAGGFDAMSVSTNQETGKIESERMFSDDLKGRKQFFRKTLQKFFGNIIFQAEQKEAIENATKSVSNDSTGFEIQED